MILTDKQVLELHRLTTKLYEKYPRYVVCTITYDTDVPFDTTLSPKKSVGLNIYTPLINHNQFSTFEGFEKFVNQILVDGIENVRIKVLEGTIESAKAGKQAHISAIKKAQEELNKLKGIKL